MASPSNLLAYRRAFQSGYPQLAVPHTNLLAYNLGVGLAVAIHHVSTGYKWDGDALFTAQLKQVASSVQQMLTAGCNSPGTNLARKSSDLDPTRPMMDQLLPL